MNSETSKTQLSKPRFSDTTAQFNSSGDDKRSAFKQDNATAYDSFQMTSDLRNTDDLQLDAFNSAMFHDDNRAFPNLKHANANSASDHDPDLDASMDEMSSDDEDGDHMDVVDDNSGDSGGKKQSFGSRKTQGQVAKAKNREHAKNTRIRKKNYIDSLKDIIKSLSDERVSVDQERKAALTKLAEIAMTRKKVLQTMFYFRATGEMSPARWETVLEPDFLLVMPITPYRTFPPTEVFHIDTLP